MQLQARLRVIGMCWSCSDSGQAKQQVGKIAQNMEKWLEFDQENEVIFAEHNIVDNDRN